MISVIMTSYLEDYPGARKDPETKFVRAVNSFIAQDIGSDNCELVIVSDGCEITNRLYEQHFKLVPNITIIKQEKSKNRYPGEHRQTGIESSRFDYITYLDSDDFFLENRLSNCYSAIKESKYPFILDTIYNMPAEHKQLQGVRIGEFEKFGIKFIKTRIPWKSGTFQFVHTKHIKTRWKGSNFRGEDYHFSRDVLKLNRIPEHHIKIEIDGYVVCHHEKFGFDV